MMERNDNNENVNGTQGKVLFTCGYITQSLMIVTDGGETRTYF